MQQARYQNYRRTQSQCLGADSLVLVTWVTWDKSPTLTQAQALKRQSLLHSEIVNSTILLHRVVTITCDEPHVNFYTFTFSGA